MPKQTAKQDLPTSPHVVLAALKHNGESYDIGDTVQLTDPQAKRLLAAKIVKAPAAK